MTIPRTNLLPPVNSKITDKENQEYQSSVYELKRNYETLSKGINGDIKSSYQVGNSKWTPTIQGSTVPGTINYLRQVGWVYRQNLLVDIWCDIRWDAVGAAAGTLLIDLPYKVANSDGFPFVGEVYPINIAFPVGYTAATSIANPNTYQLQVWLYGSLNITTPLTIPAVGHLLCHIRYLGVQDER